jgi:prolyl oligopeptidase
MKIYFLLVFSFICTSLFSQNIPVTKKVSSTLQKHDLKIQDDYSWLQNLNSEEVTSWVNAQNSATNAKFDEINVSKIASKIKEYDFLSTNSLPVKKGKYFYSMYRMDKNQPASLFYRKSLNDNSVEIVNPFKIYKDNNAVLNSYYPSKNATYIAYEISLNGSDRKEIRFSNINKKEVLKDIIKDSKFTNIAWYQDKGVFYKKNSNKNVMAKDSTYQLYYHAIGTTQEEDKLVYDVTKSESTISFFTTNNKLFIIEKSRDELKKSFYFINLENDNYEKEVILENDISGFNLLECNNNKIYFSTKDYDWGEVRCFDINNKSEVKIVIPQIYNNLLVDTSFYNNYIICKYKTVDKYYLRVYDIDGNFIRKFDAPESMDFMVRFFDSDTNVLYVTFFSHVISAQNFKLNLKTGEVDQFYNEFIRPLPILFPLNHFITKKITFKSRDNKDVPITIIYKKDLILDGNNPTLLKSYGGFGSISGPNYDTGLLYFLEKGGVYAFAEIRGGGEKGLKWHKDGMRLKKMNSFNDFIDASEFLIKEKYTSPDKLAITGGSYGGLVVGVAMTQRPELYKVAVPKMGVFDMLTFSEYSVGKYHLDEFGNPENKTDFTNLLSYSPYQKVKEEINYPTTLIITGENDDRVPPFNSYKFAAALQNRTAQKNSVFLKTLENSGHSGKISTYQNRVNESAEFYGFLLYYLNK